MKLQLLLGSSWSCCTELSLHFVLLQTPPPLPAPFSFQYFSLQLQFFLSLLLNPTYHSYPFTFSSALTHSSYILLVHTQLSLYYVLGLSTTASSHVYVVIWNSVFSELITNQLQLWFCSFNCITYFHVIPSHLDIQLDMILLHVAKSQQRSRISSLQFYC